MLMVMPLVQKSSSPQTTNVVFGAKFMGHWLWSVHPKLQHFGLGNSKTVYVTVIWPNGKQQRLAGLKINQSYTIQQDAENEHVARYQ